MAETIEKITRTDPEPKNGKKLITVTERIILRRANFRFLLAVLILCVYAFTIYSLMYAQIQMDDKTSTLLVSVISTLTVLISQVGSWAYGKDEDGKENDKEENKEGGEKQNA